jgi:L-iditol 2-dehydrogenase
MKAAVLKGIREFEVQNIPEPKLISDTDVLIRIKMIGICGSDVHYYTTGRIGSQVVTYPFIIGHEAAGIVERIGKKVTRVKPGQKVAIDPAVTCGKCDQCLSGRVNTCRELVFMGNPQQKQGAMCEFIVHDEKSCFPVKDQTTFEQIVISEPMAIAVYAVEQTKLVPGARVGIIGVGPVGMSVFHVLRTTAADKVYISDKIRDRLKFAQQLGPAWSCNPHKTDIVNEIKKREPLGLDVVYECSGDPVVFEHAIALLKPGGILAIIGIPDTDQVSFPIHEMRRKEITILNIRRQADCTQKALDLIESRKINVDSMATHHFRLEETRAAFELVSEYRDGVMKTMISID